jgi:hypothetical protein
MSCTSVYAVYKTKATCIKELKNGWGSGPAVWDYISLKCTGERMPSFGDNKEFWKLWKSDKLTTNEKAVLLSTYDMAFVEVDRLKEFSEACHCLHEKIISDTHWKWNHFDSIGDSALELSKNHDRRCLGLGIGCTSVCDPWEGNSDREQWPIYESIEDLLNEE